ncbi:MAG TPA: hypothetical protein VMS12_13025 [Thermoanaerobaculia bacterium]|nr:hypothetical protein [Thermoanaerobaculia bacterium]
MIEAVLAGLRARVEGTRAVSLVGVDGIPVHTLSDGEIPVDSMSAEFGAFIRTIRLSSTELDTGEVTQFALVTEKYTTFLSAVSPDYFILMVLTPGGNYGRARFELSKAKQALGAELA